MIQDLRRLSGAERFVMMASLCGVKFLDANYRTIVGNNAPVCWVSARFKNEDGFIEECCWRIDIDNRPDA